MPSNKKMTVIDIETLEIWNSLSECSLELCCTVANVSKAIQEEYRCKGRRLEYFDWWLGWDNRDKEKYTRKNNIYFI